MSHFQGSDRSLLMQLCGTERHLPQDRHLSQTPGASEQRAIKKDFHHSDQTSLTGAVGVIHRSRVGPWVSLSKSIEIFKSSNRSRFDEILTALQLLIWGISVWSSARTFAPDPFTEINGSCSWKLVIHSSQWTARKRLKDVTWPVSLQHCRFAGHVTFSRLCLLGLAVQPHFACLGADVAGWNTAAFRFSMLLWHTDVCVCKAA